MGDRISRTVIIATTFSVFLRHFEVVLPFQPRINDAGQRPASLILGWKGFAAPKAQQTLS